MAKKKSKKDTLKDEVFEEVIIDEGDNNMEDLPRGLQIDTTTDSSGSAANKNKGGQIKPVKAALGLGILASKKGREKLKQFYKGKAEIASSAPGMAAMPKTLSKGGDVTVGKGGDYIKDLID